MAVRRGAGRSTARCLACCLLLALVTCEEQPSPVAAHRQKLLANAQPPTGAAQQQHFSKSFPHGSVSETVLEKHDESDFQVYHNLWYHASRFYGVHSAVTMRANVSGIGVAMTKNLGITTISATDVKEFYRNVQARWLGGTSLLIDQPYPAFPDNMGHWAEVLLPIYSLLSSEAWLASHRHVDTIVFGNLQRNQLEKLDWVWAMLKLVFAPATPPGRELPHTVFYDDFGQVEKTEWLCIEEAVVMNARYTHPAALPGFKSPQLGQRFREAAYAAHGINASVAAPRTITLLTNVAAEQVANLPELTAVMKDVGRAFGYRVRPLSITSGAPFQSFLATMARTGVLVSRHGPQLANAIFLPPGAVVVELLPYNWQWAGICELYRNISRSLGDVHHVAWRANDAKWAVYATADDERYGTWTAAECGSTYCLEAHARAGMVVDTATVAELTMDTLKSVCDSPAAPKLRPWPEEAPAVKPELWWQR